MNNVMAYPGFPGPGPSAGQGVPSYPFPGPGPQGGQLNPQPQTQRQIQYGYPYNQPSGASMLPPQKPNASAPAAFNGSVSNVNVQSFATPPIPSPSHPPIQASTSQAVTQASSMANATITTTAAAPSTSAKTTPTSEAPPSNLPQQASKLSPKDEKRVAALLNLNNVIIKELAVLQASGPDKPQSPPQPSNPTGAPAVTSPTNNNPATGVSTTPTNANASSTTTVVTPTSATTPTTRAAPSKKQMTDNYSRRLQVNIAYLLGMSQNKPVPSFPQAMEPPPEAWIAAAEGTKEEQKERWEDMKDGYGRLKECWPEYRLGMRPQIPAGMNQGSNQGQTAQQGAGGHGGQQAQQTGSQGSPGRGQQQQGLQVGGNFQGNAQVVTSMQQNLGSQAQAQAQGQGFTQATTTQQIPAQPQSQI